MVKFLLTCILMGIGLAMDSATVSMTNGLIEQNMKVKKNIFISLTFGIFQGIMPLIGYFISSAFVTYIGKYIPWIALVLLSLLGTKSIVETIKEHNKKRKIKQKIKEIQSISDEIIDNGKKESNEVIKKNVSKKFTNYETKKIKFSDVIVQGIATSIDALCVGVVIANYTYLEAFICTGIVAVITFILSFVSTFIGKKFGFKFGEKAELASGIILILVGIEICITGLI